MIAIAVLALLSLGCSAADLVMRWRITPTPAEEIALVPTYTPSPEPMQTRIVVTPPSEGRPGIIIVPPGMDPNVVIPVQPTPLPQTPFPPTTTTPPPAEQIEVTQPSDQVTAQTPDTTQVGPGPIPTSTSVPFPISTNTPVPTPTPYVMVESGLITLRTGPGIDYPFVAQLGPDIPVAVTGSNPDGSWLQICCISGESLWIPTSDVVAYNDISQLSQASVPPPPPPTATPTLTITPTPTPTPTATPYPFERAIGPQFFPTSNEFLTIWAKLFIGTAPFEVPASGYYLTVLFEGFERPNHAGSGASIDKFEFSAPPGSGSRVEYNYKYEYHPPDPQSIDPPGELSALQLLGTGTWTVYVSDGAGRQLSDIVTFTTAPDNPNREVYIGWARVR